MNKRLVLALTLAVVLISSLAAACAAPAPAPAPSPAPAPAPSPAPSPSQPAQVFNWVGQSAFPGTLAYALPFKLWIDKVQAMSGGRLMVEFHGGGEIVGGMEVLDAVRDGTLDCGLNIPVFQRGQYPAADLFYGLPAGIIVTEDLMIWMFGGEGRSLYQEMYGTDTVIIFPIGFSPPEEIWTNKPIKTIEDFQGLKIRTAGIALDVFNKLGASVVMLDTPDVVPSLQRGVVDAAEFGDPSIDVGMGLQDVAKYLNGPPIHMTSNMWQLAINPKKWQELPDDLKAIVENASTAAAFEGYAQLWMQTIEAFKQIQGSGVQVVRLTPEAQARAREVAFEVLDEKSQEDPFYAKVWASQKAFLEGYEGYKNLSKFD